MINNMTPPVKKHCQKLEKQARHLLSQEKDYSCTLANFLFCENSINFRMNCTGKERIVKEKEKRTK